MHCNVWATPIAQTLQCINEFEKQEAHRHESYMQLPSYLKLRLSSYGGFLVELYWVGVGLSFVIGVDYTHYCWLI
jgi:hypothetical protein